MRIIKIGFESKELNKEQDDVISALLEGRDVELNTLSAYDKNIIGLCYYYGLHLKQDYKKAVYWYSLAAEEELPAAEKNMGNCYNEGNGVEKDEKQAFYWYERAANHGYSAAQWDIAEMYDKGIGVAKDKEKARYWAEKSIASAVENNKIDVLNFIGDCYRHGDNILEKDYKKAAEFYRKAAELNNPLSKMNLAFMIQDGEIEGSDEEIERLVSEAAASDLPFMLSHGNYASDGIK